MSEGEPMGSSGEQVVSSEKAQKTRSNLLIAVTRVPEWLLQNTHFQILATKSLANGSNEREATSSPSELPIPIHTGARQMCCLLAHHVSVNTVEFAQVFCTRKAISSPCWLLSGCGNSSGSHANFPGVLFPAGNKMSHGWPAWSP